MGPNDQKHPVILNIGCGFSKMIPPVINVDKYEICKPDVIHDLDVFPYPWEDDSVDHVYAFHIMEHLNDWWGALNEVTRILKPGGKFEMRVPDESSTSAGTYRDHLNIISIYSFCGLQNALIQRHNTNAWAAKIDNTVPLVLEHYWRVPFPEYNWICKWLPWVFNFLVDHTRNWIWEQRFCFRKTKPIGGSNEG